MTESQPDPRRPVRIANCSGFFGDRLSAANEMVEGGDIDVLTGDWLAELTMFILHKQRSRNAELGYARTFLLQMEQVLGTCIERGIKVVTNAGGLNPSGCADKVREIASRLGITASVAHLEGDDLMDRVDGLRAQMAHLDTGAPLVAEAITANAYLGGWGIAAALRNGADVVVCPRVTDAALVVGPAAWWHGWALDDWDRLAGAVVAGHIVECGTQATGGNYTWFDEIPDLSKPLGFPIAEVAADGSSVITKHEGTGGVVSVGTVTAQLLYEIGTLNYANPDVVTRFDTITLAQQDPNRVQVSGVRGLPAPPTAKVCINLDGGYRNRMTFALTGQHQKQKAEWLETVLFNRLGGKERFEEVAVRLVEAPSDAPTQEQASGRLHITVKSHDERLVGRTFSSAAIEMALANYPGFFVTSAPADAESFGVYWPALVDAAEVAEVVVMPDGTRVPVAAPPRTHVVSPATQTDEVRAKAVGPAAGETLGTYFAARSGDKGGNANVGIWARDDAGYAWLRDNLSTATVRRLLPEASELEVRRVELPNLHALNFVIVGLLGEGVASNTAFDPQAKGLGEYLLSRVWR
ncbi:MAG: acyclic terpene utilization AtuA family protein [Ilumatobacteraceae bacterium]